MRTQIAAVVNLHREGSSATPSIISAWRAVQWAAGHSISAGLVLALDRADEATEAVAHQWTARGATIVDIDAGDLGLARNAVAEAVDAEWIAFLDADDLWGEYWLELAYLAATSETSSNLTVWHPALNVIFGDHHSLLHHVDSEDDSFSWSRFRLHNQWTALSFVRRSGLLAVPFPRNDLDRGFGFEDWSWNEEILRRGGRHRVVPRSCHFIFRSTDPSLLSRSQKALRTRYPADSQQTHVPRPTLNSLQEGASGVSEETHVVAKVSLDDTTVEQVRGAATIEPRILETVEARPRGPALPQNFQTHRSAAQRALDEIEVARASSRPDNTLAQLLESSPSLRKLSAGKRSIVVAEVLLDAELADRERGTSTYITEAITHYPQLSGHEDHS